MSIANVLAKKVTQIVAIKPLNVESNGKGIVYEKQKVFFKKIIEVVVAAFFINNRYWTG